MATAVQGKLKWQKKFRSISRLPRERPYPELRNEPPLDSLEKPVPNPLLASLWIGSGAGWPLKGLGVASPDYQVGAHFEGLDQGVLMTVLKSFENFLAISKPAAALWYQMDGPLTFSQCGSRF